MVTIFRVCSHVKQCHVHVLYFAMDRSDVAPRNSQVFILVQTRYAAYRQVDFYSCQPVKTLRAFVAWAGFIAHQCYIAPRGHGEIMPTLPD